MNAKSSKITGWVAGSRLMLVGFLCLNYTNGFGIEHRAEWASKHELPAPTFSIFLVGAAVGALGAGVVGHTLGCGARPAD